MNPRSIRSLSWLLLPLLLAACASPGPASAAATVPLGADLGASGPVVAPAPPAAAPSAAARAPAASQHGMRIAHEGRDDGHGTGIVNSVDPAGHKVNLSHQPIPELGWPAMTMDFGVAPAVDLRAITPGARVNFTIEKGQGGIYEIKAIAPAGGGR